MQNYLGIVLLFLIDLFFIHLGINGLLKKQERKILRKRKNLIGKVTGFHIFYLKNMNVYKILLILMYVSFFLNLLFNSFVLFTNNNLIRSLLDFSIRGNFIILFVIIIVNYCFSF